MTVRLWDMSTCQLLKKLLGHTNTLESVACSPDGSMLASGGEDIRLWDATSGQLLRTIYGNGGKIRSVSFSPGGIQLASVSEGETIFFFEIHAVRLLTAAS